MCKTKRVMCLTKRMMKLNRMIIVHSCQPARCKILKSVKSDSYLNLLSVKAFLRKYFSILKQCFSLIVLTVLQLKCRHLFIEGGTQTLLLCSTQLFRGNDNLGT